MLNMGFLEDIEWIIDQLPQNKQMVLFSTTMPNEMRNIAKKYLNDRRNINQKCQKETQLISQNFYMYKYHKLDALKRILELNNDGVIIFVRTKLLTTSIAEAYSGHTVAVLNGDIPQNQRKML